MFRIGLSTNAKEYGEALFAEFAKAGIDAMEISLPKEECDRFDFDSAAEYSKKYGVELWSFHLPSIPGIVDISSPLLQKSTLNYLCEFIRKGAAAGIGRFVVHPSGEPIPDEERAIRLKTSCESLPILAEEAERNGVVIAVEDLPRTCLGRNSEEMLKLLDSDKRLRVCLDTNHLLSENLIDFIGRIGDKIVTTHISDYDRIDEKHWLPGEGVNDWQAVVKALQDKNYNGVWLYEVAFKKPTTRSRSRNLNAADFVRNAEEIFSGLPITKIE